jgi:hypothetical protein
MQPIQQRVRAQVSDWEDLRSKAMSCISNTCFSF